MNRIVAAAFILAFAQVSNTRAESSGERRGLVTTAACPYSCKDAGLNSQDCAERRVGDSCQIEDFTQPPGHRSMVRVGKDAAPEAQNFSNARAKETTLMVDPDRRGLITSSTCPYTCKDAGLQMNVCRESRVGDTCRIEDFTQPPGHRTLVRVAKDS
ncbi:MAG: hypothetical protein KDD66_16890 [Bdellovibrionales bacterium]|nr:hypothetical protein [Bdellovibrionales bacterium]